MRFASFLSGGLITDIVVNSPERKTHLCVLCVGRMEIFVALLLSHTISISNKIQLQNLIDKNKHAFLRAIIRFNTTIMIFSR